MIREKVVCFKEGKQLFGDNSFDSLRDEKSDCNRATVRRVRFVTFFEDREDVCKFPRRREYTKMVRKLEKLVENRGELKDTGL